MRSTDVSCGAVLFPWNPKRTYKYKWDSKFLACSPLIHQLQRGHGFQDAWNIGRRLGVPKNTVAYLVRVSNDHPGVVLSGKTHSGQRIGRVGQFQTLLTWSRGIEWIKYPPMPLAEVFGARRAKRIGFSLQQPGHTICPTDAARLATAWNRWVEYYAPGMPMDAGARAASRASSIAERRAILREAREYEGSAVLHARVLVSRHVRRCDCCRMSTQRKYGKAIEEILEVHHCEQIRLRGCRRKVDVVALLCPSCHRAVHQSSPPMAPSLLRVVVKRAVTN